MSILIYVVYIVIESSRESHREEVRAYKLVESNDMDISDDETHGDNAK
jgi:hypothetical protein